MEKGNWVEGLCSRRSFLRTAALAGTGALFSGRAVRAVDLPQSRVGGAANLSLADLPYAADALEPYIDRRTMEIHHGRHHAAYARNTVTALADYPEIGAQSLERILADIGNLPSSIRTSIRNNGGGHWNHELFWELMSPAGGGEPVGAVAEAIAEKWGSYTEFLAAFKTAAMTRFGSGWAWLLVDQDGELQISSTPNQDNPLMQGLVEVTGSPILGLDVWEHAYYLHYQNRRGDYVDAWWNIVNWPKVDALYRVARG